MKARQEQVKQHCNDRDISEVIGVLLFQRGYALYRNKHGSVKHLIGFDHDEYQKRMDKRIETAYRFARRYAHYCEDNNIRPEYVAIH